MTLTAPLPALVEFPASIVFVVRFPVEGIVQDVTMDVLMIPSIPNHVLIIIPLPDGRRAAAPLHDLTRDGGFVLANDRCQ